MTSPATNIVPFEYQGQPVRFNTDGWINATDVAKRFDRLPNEWLRVEETKRYMDALAAALNAGESRNLVRTSRGRNGGTWLHPKLAVAFARWLDMRFSVWCDAQIDKLIHGDQDDWQHLRDSAAIGYQGMCDALNLTRQAQGKQSAPHHFMNEAKLINGVLYGEFKGRDRRDMDRAELRLIGQGLDYQDRKQALTEYAEQHLRPRLAGGAA
ncbi:KilA-N domain-containing protein [Halomonas sp. LBP4]|uniref:KilA-N domain-containing protein n=1 Tax=Halomonas sp. LBP4 TaxID=2044917 RepID=UPI000D76FFDB|nr:KilA-N domain-containing protein [Halomonas sp. LBP4]PXX97360.1 DNA-binding protein [Halomonas sp. LBP4]